MLRAIFLVGSVGTAAELLLLEHTEGASQLIPLILLFAGCLAALLLTVRPGTGSLRLFQATMLAFIIGGAVGVFLHYAGNMEFELELQPDASRADLAWESMKGATPVLAPGTMALLGAIGLASSQRRNGPTPA
jgi:hypothetical protein